MTDIHDMRTRLREERGRPVASGAGFKIPFGVLAAGAVILGFVVVMLTPRLYSVQRTAALPDFKESRERSDSPLQAAMTAAVPPNPAAPSVGAPSVAPPSPVPSNPAQYAGKNADEIAKIADGVCAQRVAMARNAPPANAAGRRERDPVQARKVTDDLGNPKVAIDNERLSCFLSEGVPRFCSGSQKRKATADIINYFKGIEYTNAALGVAQKVLEMPGPVPAPFKPDPAEAAARKAAQAEIMLTPDPRVVEAIEGLMRAGYLTKAHRDDIAVSVPRAYKERFARIAGNKAPCPEAPWWAVWK
jgi:hypothetical protein